MTSKLGQVGNDKMVSNSILDLVEGERHGQIGTAILNVDSERLHFTTHGKSLGLRPDHSDSGEPFIDRAVRCQAVELLNVLGAPDLGALASIGHPDLLGLVGMSCGKVELVKQ